MQRNRLLSSSLWAALLLGSASCGKSEEPAGAVNPSTTSAGTSTTLRISIEGGILQHEGARFEFPKECFSAERAVTVDVLRDFPPPANRNRVLVSKAYRLEAGQFRFDKPITVTLPFDRTQLPPGIRAEDLSPVVAWEGAYEPLPVQKLDLDRQQITFELDHLIPRSHFCGSATVLAEETNENPAIGISGQYDTLETVSEDADLVLRAPPENKEVARARWAVLKKALDRVRMTCQERDFVPPPAPIRIGFLPEQIIKNLGEACYPDQILLRLDLADAPEEQLEFTFCHEYFHLVQYGSLRGFETGPGTLGWERWADEATAEWVGYHLYPRSLIPLSRAATTTHEFFHGPFFVGRSEQHPYRSFLFFCYLDHTEEDIDFPILTGSSSGIDIIRALYPRPGQSEIVMPAKSFLHLLDSTISSQLDHDRRRRGLADTFVDFLIHYYWKKDFEPFASILNDSSLSKYAAPVLSNLGKPGTLKLDPDHLVGWNIPYVEGKERKLRKDFEKVQTLSFGIAKTYNISSMTLEDEKGKKLEKGKLELRLDAPPGDQVQLVVFPYGNEGPLDPLFGIRGLPVIVPDWQELGGAVVWIVDVSPEGPFQVKLTAELKPESGKWLLQIEEHPMGRLSCISHRSMKLSPSQAVSPDSDLARQLKNHWVHATLEIAGRICHAYGQFDGNAVAWFTPLYLPVKQGKYKYRMVVQFRNETIACEGTSVVELGAKDLARLRDDVQGHLRQIEECKERLEQQDPGRRAEIEGDLCRQFGFLAGTYYSLGEFDQAKSAAESALRTAPQGSYADTVRCTLGDLYRISGDFDGALLRYRDSKRSYNAHPFYSYLATDSILIKNDLPLARKFATLHENEMRKLGDKEKRPWPFPDKEKETDILR